LRQCITTKSKNYPFDSNQPGESIWIVLKQFFSITSMFSVILPKELLHYIHNSVALNSCKYQNDKLTSPTNVSLSRTRKAPSESDGYACISSSATVRPFGTFPWNHFSPTCSSSLFRTYNSTSAPVSDNHSRVLDNLPTPSRSSLYSQSLPNETFLDCHSDIFLQAQRLCWHPTNCAKPLTL